MSYEITTWALYITGAVCTFINLLMDALEEPTLSRRVRCGGLALLLAVFWPITFLAYTVSELRRLVRRGF
tara:strand:+ start:290 stop:499 length:210 start_codon:yes stop_codon:yes gene_type:complete